MITGPCIVHAPRCSFRGASTVTKDCHFRPSLASLRAADEHFDDGAAKEDIVAKAKDTGDLIRMGVDPSRGYVEDRRRLIGHENGGESAEPFFDRGAPEAEVASQAKHTRDHFGVSCDPGVWDAKQVCQFGLIENAVDDNDLRTINSGFCIYQINLEVLR